MRITYTDLTTFKGCMTWELNSVGAFALKGVSQDFFLFPTEQWENIAFLEDVKIKKDCKIFRYQTATSAIGGFAPFISVNMVSGLVYFLDDMYAEEISFQTKAEFPEWVSINATQK